MYSAGTPLTKGIMVVLVVPLIEGVCIMVGVVLVYFFRGVCLTNRFHVAMRLFSNRSQMTSKCRKNKEVAHEPQASVSLLFLPHFDVLCDLLLNRPTATWNLFSLACFSKARILKCSSVFFFFGGT